MPLFSSIIFFDKYLKSNKKNLDFIFISALFLGKFMTLLSSANQLSQIVTMPLSARLCVTSGWSSVYYFHGLASAVFAILFFVVFRRTPRTHPCVNKKELHFITKGGMFPGKDVTKVSWYFSVKIWNFLNVFCYIIFKIHYTCICLRCYKILQKRFQE